MSWSFIASPFVQAGEQQSRRSLHSDSALYSQQQPQAGGGLLPEQPTSWPREKKTLRSSFRERSKKMELQAARRERAESKSLTEESTRLCTVH